jgi:catechol 2,3-dioxygenase
MNEVRVSALRGVELNVLNLDESADFYRKAWGLEAVAREGGVMYLRGSGAEHHILTLHEAPRASLHSIDFAVQDRASVDGYIQRLRDRQLSYQLVLLLFIIISNS